MHHYLDTSNCCETFVHLYLDTVNFYKIHLHPYLDIFYFIDMHAFVSRCSQLFHIYLHLYLLQWIADSVQKSVSDP